MISAKTFGQLVRYGTVGVLSNLALYGIYLTLTYWGLGSKLTMTLLYIAGVAQTFFFNKRWSFRSNGQSHPEFVRYCLTYAFGYLFNLTALFLLVDALGFPHQVVQGLLILATAVLLFLLQKLWVFRRSMEAQGVP